MNNTVYLYVFDTMADWEVGYLTAELNSGRYYKKGLTPSRVVTVGIDKSFVTTMGGLKILPDIEHDECNIESADAFILPGGNTWTETIRGGDLWCYNRACQGRIAEFTMAYKQ